MASPWRPYKSINALHAAIGGVNIALITSAVLALGWCTAVVPAQFRADRNSKGVSTSAVDVPVHFVSFPFGALATPSRGDVNGRPNGTLPGGAGYSMESMQGTVQVPLTDFASRAAGDAGPVVTFGALLFVLLKLRRVLKSALDGDPFDPANVRCMRQMGLTCVVAAVVLPWGAVVMNTYLLSRVAVGRLESAVDKPLFVDFRWLVAGIAVLAFAEVFKRGSELREEERLTV